MSFKYLGLGEAFEQHLESRLTAYVVQGVHESSLAWQQSKNIFVASDKASVKGLPLQATHLVFNNNLAICAPPQVLWAQGVIGQKAL